MIFGQFNGHDFQHRNYTTTTLNRRHVMLIAAADQRPDSREREFNGLKVRVKSAAI